MLGVLPADSSTAESLLASTSFVDVDHGHSTSFAGDIAGGSVGYDAATAPPGDVSGMLNGLVAMKTAEKAGLSFNWNSQQVLNDAATTADQLDKVVNGGVGNPTQFTEVSASSSAASDHPFAFAQPTSFADTQTQSNPVDNLTDTDHHYGYTMGVKHIPIPKSIAPQPAVPLHGPSDPSRSDTPQLPPVDWGHAGKEWTMATDHSRMIANQMPGEEGVKARALQERLETIQNNQMQDAMDLIRNMDSWMKAKNPYIEKVQQLNNLNMRQE